MTSTDNIRTVATLADLPNLTECADCAGDGRIDADTTCRKCAGNGTVARVIISRNADQIAWRIVSEGGGLSITAATLNNAKESAAKFADAHEQQGEHRPEIFVVDSHETEREELLANLQHARAEARNAQADTDKLRALIAALPWDDINAGDFHPAQGCPDVARFIEQAEALGVDSADLRKGLSSAYTVVGSIVVHFTIEIDEATDEDDAISQAADLVDYPAVSLTDGYVEHVDNDYGYGWTAEAV